MHYSPKCFRNLHTCSEVCTNSNCDVNNPFICGTCEKRHKMCKTIPYKQVVQQFHLIQGLKMKQVLKFQQRVERIFSQLMKMLQDQFYKFREQFEYFNAPQQILVIYSKIKDKKQNEITGKDIFQAISLKQPQKLQYFLKKDLQLKMVRGDLIQLQQKVCNKLPLAYTLKGAFDGGYKDVGQRNEIEIVKQEYVPARKSIQGLLVMAYYEQFQQLLQRRIYNIQLMYRATKQKFSAAAFHKACDGVTQTLTMAQTQYDKIVGGYTAMPWKKTKNWLYEKDLNKTTFLFSTSKEFQGRKFVPVKEQFCLGMHQDYGPCFGDDFVIYDRADISRNCWSNFPDVFDCLDRPVLRNSATIHEFVGVQDHFEKFALKEWEVYKISFSQNDQIIEDYKQDYDRL